MEGIRILELVFLELPLWFESTHYFILAKERHTSAKSEKQKNQLII